MNVGDSGDSDLSGNVTWINPGGAKAKAYPGGFRWDGQAIGSTYRRPANGAMLIDLSSGGAVTLAGGSLSQEVSNAVSLDSHNRIVTVGGARLSLSFSPTTGTFKGTTLNPDTGRPLRSAAWRSSVKTWGQDFSCSKVKAALS